MDDATGDAAIGRGRRSDSGLFRRAWQKLGIAHFEGTIEMLSGKLMEWLTGYPMDDLAQKNVVDIAVFEFDPRLRSKRLLAGQFDGLFISNPIGPQRETGFEAG